MRISSLQTIGLLDHIQDIRTTSTNAPKSSQLTNSDSSFKSGRRFETRSQWLPDTPCLFQRVPCHIRNTNLRYRFIFKAQIFKVPALCSSLFKSSQDLILEKVRWRELISNSLLLAPSCRVRLTRLCTLFNSCHKDWLFHQTSYWTMSSAQSRKKCKESTHFCKHQQIWNQWLFANF